MGREGGVWEKLFGVGIGVFGLILFFGRLGIYPADLFSFDLIGITTNGFLDPSGLGWKMTSCIGMV
jgi:hypothetical protein